MAHDINHRDETGDVGALLKFTQRETKTRDA